MPTLAVADQAAPAADAATIRRQLETMLRDESLRTSRRSVAFLRYIVEQTLEGNAEELKERTIGVNVFGRPLTYDTNVDHVVRTAASELRKRLAIYYGAEEHRDQFRILLVPGSYVPQFREAPANAEAAEAEPTPSQETGALETAPPRDSMPAQEPRRGWHAGWVGVSAGCAALVLLAALALPGWRPGAAGMPNLFWGPLLQTEGPVLIAVGEVPNGPPVPSEGRDAPPLPTAPASSTPTLPYADSVAMARVAAMFARAGKSVVFRRESSITFADLRDRPVVLIGAFNNQWSLRLSRELRFSLAMDFARRTLYIRDRNNPEGREWFWSIDPHPGERERTNGATLHDYALVSRILDSETGHELIMLGGLSTYGTQAASEFVNSTEMQTLMRTIAANAGHRQIQIVLQTDVTEGTPGPARVLATHVE